MNDLDYKVMQVVTIPVELYVRQTCNGEWDPKPIVYGQVPYMVEVWAEGVAVREFILSPSRGEIMRPERIMTKIELEVVVDINAIGKAYHADCQTECPGFVQAWAENQAIKQYNEKVVIS